MPLFKSVPLFFCSLVTATAAHTQRCICLLTKVTCCILLAQSTYMVYVIYKKICILKLVATVS